MLQLPAYRYLLAAALAATSLCSALHAAVLSKDLGTTYTYGMNDQNYEGNNNGPVACGPTSVVNSFIYLQNRYGITGLVPHTAGKNAADDASAVINTLSTDMSLDPQGGVTDPNFITGKTQYIKDVGLQNQISVEYQSVAKGGVTPTAQFIFDQLNAGQDVEAGFVWSTGGGHWVTVTGINFDTTTETGTLNFIDPWGGVKITGNLSLTGGNLVLGYSGGAAGGGSVPGDGSDPDNKGNASSGTIDIVVAESPIPEPATIALLVFGAATLLLRNSTKN